ncbi:MAG: long-chain fatty acid--CoA ligase [Deltaproteobacteria bacterium]|nr:MAG: long-chain fatty acid--CoA ligase [Deltaproteobacteria bacterium]
MRRTLPGEDTIPAMFLWSVDQDPDSTSYFVKEAGLWQPFTRRYALEQCAGGAKALWERGIRPGDRVAIIANTCPEWAAVDLATTAIGAITVGLYPNLPADLLAYPLAHSGARIAIVEDADQAAKIEAIRDQLPELESVVTMRPTEGYEDLRAIATDHDIDFLREHAARRRPEEVATLIYTSGTTGEPKGAVLTHGNFAYVSKAVLDAVEVGDGERSIAWLPLAHALQRQTMYTSFLIGTVGYWCNSIDELPEVIAFARPQVLASVPRMLEKMQARILEGVAERGPRAEKAVHRALALGRQRLAYLERGERVPRLLELRWRLMDRLVFTKIRERLGGSLRTLAVGGAALDPEVARFYGAMGLSVVEGWGLTETAAPATVNRTHHFRFGTVGKPLPGVDVKLAEDGEICVRGPGLFQGYYKDPEATAAAFEDGWFLTGDLGEIDEDGFLSIVDRKKEILVTAGGKNIAPVPIEARLMRSPAVSQAVAIANERRFVVALLSPDEEGLAALADTLGLAQAPVAELVEHPSVRAHFQETVDRANAELPRWEQIKRWQVVPVEFTPEGGELTPTLKLKRRVIADRYAELIDELYA